MPTEYGANASISGSLTVDGDISLGSGDDDINMDNDTLFVDADTNRVGIGTDTPHTSLAVVHDYNTVVFESQISDGQGGGEILRYSPGADETLTPGQLYYLHTDGTWNQADASAAATGASQMLGVGLGSARNLGLVIKGFVRVPSTEIDNVPAGGAVDGLPVYVSETSGHFNFAAPITSGAFIRVVGYAIDDATDVLIYFDPDSSWVALP